VRFAAISDERHEDIHDVVKGSAPQPSLARAVPDDVGHL